jgi:hypothetical protein
MSKRNTMRNGTAVAALSRNSAGPMRHRLQPRGGARNEQADMMAEYEEDYAEGGYASRWDEERGYVPGR